MRKIAGYVFAVRIRAVHVCRSSTIRGCRNDISSSWIRMRYPLCRLFARQLSLGPMPTMRIHPTATQVHGPVGSQQKQA